MFNGLNLFSLVTGCAKFKTKQDFDWGSVRGTSSSLSSGDQEQLIKSLLYYPIDFYTQAKMASYMEEEKNNFQAGHLYLMHKDDI